MLIQAGQLIRPSTARGVGPVFRKRIHVYKIDSGEGWTYTTWRGYQALWHSLRHWGFRVAWHNALVLVGVR